MVRKEELEKIHPLNILYCLFAIFILKLRNIKIKRSMKKVALASSLLLSLSAAVPLSPVIYAETSQSVQVS